MTSPPQSAPKAPAATPQAAQEARKFPAQHDESYPAGMETDRSAPAGIGQDKPGPKNPDPATDLRHEDGQGKDADQSRG